MWKRFGKKVGLLVISAQLFVLASSTSLFIIPPSVAKAAGDPYFEIDNESINSSRQNTDTLQVSARLQAWRSNIFADTKLNYIKDGREYEGTFKVQLYFKKHPDYKEPKLPARWILDRVSPDSINIINPRDRNERWTFSNSVSLGVVVNIAASGKVYGHFHKILKDGKTQEFSSRYRPNDTPYVAALTGKYPGLNAYGFYPFENYIFYDDQIKNKPPDGYKKSDGPYDEDLKCPNYPQPPDKSLQSKDEAEKYLLRYFPPDKKLTQDKLAFDHIINMVELFDSNPKTCPPYALFNNSLKFFLRAAIEVGGTASSENVLFWFQSTVYKNLWLILDEDADGEISLASSPGSQRGETITGYLGSLIGSAVKLGEGNSMDKIISSRVFNVHCLDDKTVPDCTDKNKFTIITAVNCHWHKVATVRCATSQDVYKASVESSRSDTLASFYNNQAVYEDGTPMNHNAWLDVWGAQYLDTVGPGSTDDTCSLGLSDIFSGSIGQVFEKLVTCLVKDIFLPLVSWAAGYVRDAAGVSSNPSPVPSKLVWISQRAVWIGG